MKQILHIITGLKRAGAETILVTLARHLARAPYEYTQSVVYFHHGPLVSELEMLGIRCYKLSYTNFFYKLPKIIKQVQPTVIHSSLWSANLVARLYGALFSIPVYSALHTVAQHSGPLRNYIDTLMPCKPAGYIAVSAQVKASYSNILPADTVTVIENGIPSLPAGVSEREPCRQHYYTIGAVGRFVPVKNYASLLAAFARLHKEFNHTRLILLGHGPLEAALRAQALQLNIQDVVQFVINQPAQEFYSRFDCFVQPSDHEGFSLTTAEALQAGVPTIVTGVTDHIFVEHEKHGLVIAPNCTQQLYQALKRYMLSPQEAQFHAAQGQQLVQKKFCSARMTRQYHDLFSNQLLYKESL